MQREEERADGGPDQWLLQPGLGSCAGPSLCGASFLFSLFWVLGVEIVVLLKQSGNKMWRFLRTNEWKGDEFVWKVRVVLILWVVWLGRSRGPSALVAAACEICSHPQISRVLNFLFRKCFNSVLRPSLVDFLPQPFFWWACRFFCFVQVESWPFTPFFYILLLEGWIFPCLCFLFLYFLVVFSKEFHLFSSRLPRWSSFCSRACAGFSGLLPWFRLFSVVSSSLWGIFVTIFL